MRPSPCGFTLNRDSQLLNHANISIRATTSRLHPADAEPPKSLATPNSDDMENHPVNRSMVADARDNLHAGWTDAENGGS
jgi:hypothetical protein